MSQPEIADTSTPEVSVSIVLYNSEDRLAACLDALDADVDAGRAMVIGVDNASPDGSVEIFKAKLPSARVILSEVNRGFASGCNAAWREVGTKYWLLLNPDVVIDAGSLEQLMGWMNDHPEVGLGSPWLRSAGGAPAYPGRTFPSISRTVLEMLRLHLLLPSRTRASLLQGSYVRERPPGTGVMPSDWIPGTALIARREAVLQVGPLDETFFLYGEDLEWCWRMRRAGWEVATCPAATAVHHDSTSSRRTWSEADVEARIAAGIAQACRQMRGQWYARAYALTTWLALSIEAWHPQRGSASRRHSRSIRRAWWQAATSLR